MHDAPKKFYLTPIEYAILLAGKGVREHYTLQADEVEAGEEEICMAMAHLYRTGFIESDSETFFITEQLDELITVAAEAEAVFCVRFGRHEKRDFCCFAKDENMALLCLSRNDENCYEISRCNREKMSNILEQNLVTTEGYEAVLEEESCYQELCESRESISKELIRKFHNLLLSLEEISPLDGAVKKRFLVRFTEQGILGEEVKKSKDIRISSEKDICEKIREIVENGGK